MGFWGALQRFGELGNVGSFRAGRFINEQRNQQLQGWVGIPAWTPQIPPHRLTPRLLGCCFAAPRVNLIGNRVSGAVGSGLCFLPSPFAGARQPPGMGTEGSLWPGRPRASASGRHKGASCHRWARSPRGQLCPLPRDARRQRVLETPLCLWCRAEDAGEVLGWAERVFWVGVAHIAVGITSCVSV